jgi:hypothetical protein
MRAPRHLVAATGHCVRNGGSPRSVVLSETDYQETLLTSITPDWIRGSRGIHTFNENAEFRVIDSRFLIPLFDFNIFFSLFSRSEAEFGNSFVRESRKNSRRLCPTSQEQQPTGSDSA